MAKIIGGIGTAHVPAIGAAVDHGKQGEDYWKDFFAGIEPCKEWIKQNKPDVCFIVYNDHASSFSLGKISQPSPLESPMSLSRPMRVMDRVKYPVCKGIQSLHGI